MSKIRCFKLWLPEDYAVRQWQEDRSARKRNLPIMDVAPSSNIKTRLSMALRSSSEIREELQENLSLLVLDQTETVDLFDGNNKAEGRMTCT
jgi:hypothetical protein